MTQIFVYFVSFMGAIGALAGILAAIWLTAVLITIVIFQVYCGFRRLIGRPVA